jgi:hypothetical protein
VDTAWFCPGAVEDVVGAAHAVGTPTPSASSGTPAHTATNVLDFFTDIRFSPPDEPNTFDARVDLLEQSSPQPTSVWLVLPRFQQTGVAWHGKDRVTAQADNRTPRDSDEGPA